MPLQFLTRPDQIRGKTRQPSGLPLPSGFQLFERLKLVEPLDEKQISNLFDDFQRIRNPAGPERVPDLIDLASNIVGEHESLLISSVKICRSLPEPQALWQATGTTDRARTEDQLLSYNSGEKGIGRNELLRNAVGVSVLGRRRRPHGFLHCLARRFGRIARSLPDIADDVPRAMTDLSGYIPGRVTNLGCNVARGMTDRSKGFFDLRTGWQEQAKQKCTYN
jgi:hypothetical protein